MSHGYGGRSSDRQTDGQTDGNVGNIYGFGSNPGSLEASAMPIRMAIKVRKLKVHRTDKQPRD